MGSDVPFEQPVGSGQPQVVNLPRRDAYSTSVKRSDDNKSPLLVASLVVGLARYVLVARPLNGDRFEPGVHEAICQICDEGESVGTG